MQPSEAEWQALYAGLKKKTGVDFNEYRQPQLQRRIISFAGQVRCKTLTEFTGFLMADAERIDILLDKLAINVTELFRNPEKWADLEQNVLPDLLSRSPSLKVWSAGCSYGAEAVTLAMILQKSFPGAHRIIGTDIDDAALKQANSGLYSAADVKGVPLDLARKHVSRQPDGTFLVSPQTRACITYRRQNLLADRFDQGFDLIMCRNVVIYFNDEAKDQLYERFVQSLKPGGVLFVGSTERIYKAKEIGLETPWPFFYRKPIIEREQRWRRAS